MARKADLLFLKLAVKNRILDEDSARKVVELLDRAEKAGQATKARYICVERGLMDEKTGKQLKRIVKEYLESQAEQATTGRRIGNYEVEKKLGAGAMGIVYRARHVKLGRPVALKLLLPEFAQDDKYVERFEREARAAAQLNHPNVVQCFDAGTENDVVYIAMEFVDGENVKEIVERDGPMAEKRAVEIVAQVAKALEHATQAGLMHRDVKPANIMITREGGAKLLDLGLAKKVDREEESDLTQPGRAIGTPYYMAPEQALDGGIDYRADLYALGATLFFMLVGEPPYKAASPTGVLAKHVNDPIPSVRARRAELSVGVEKVVTRMLAKKPEDRYQKHANLIQDLSDLASGLMPEIKDEPALKSKTPTARAKRSRMGSDTERSGSGSKNAPKKQSSFALAAGIVAVGAIGAFFVATSGSKPTQTAAVVTTAGQKKAAQTFSALDGEKADGPSQPIVPLVNKPEEAGSPLEQAARRHFEDAKKSGKTGWDLAYLYDNIGRSYAGTKAGEEARCESARMQNQLDAAERVDLEKDAVAIDARAKAGDLLGAADAYMALGNRFKGDAQRIARERGQACEKKAEEIVLAADERARRHAAEGHEDLAANAIKSTLELRRGAARQAAEDQIALYTRQFASRAQEAEQEKLAQEMSKARSLAGDLRESVRSKHAAAAVELAHAAVKTFTTEPARVRAQALADQMDELYSIPQVAARALVVLKGQRVRLETQNGAHVIDGILKGVSEQHLSIEIENGKALTRVGYEELDDLGVAQLIRRSKAVDDAKVLHLMAVLKVYLHGDEDAVAAAYSVKDEALAAVCKDLGPAPEMPVAKNEPREPVNPKGNANADVRPASGNQMQPAGDEGREREQLVYDNREKLFPGATESAWQGNTPVAFYNFTQGNKDFRGLWKLESGTAVPTPAGQNREGLSLRSSEGRAVFEPLFAGAVKVRVEFMNFGQLTRDSRFSVVVEDAKKKARFETLLGVPHMAEKGKKPQAGQEPEDLLQRLGPGKVHSLTLELTKDGKYVSKLDDEVLGTLETKDLGDLRIALEWEKVSMNIMVVEVFGMPNDAWLKKQIPSDTKKK